MIAANGASKEKAQVSNRGKFTSLASVPDVQLEISAVLCINLTTYCHEQAHIKELEEEVKVLKNLSHPNIVVSTFYILSKFWLYTGRGKGVMLPDCDHSLACRDTWVQSGRRKL